MTYKPHPIRTVALKDINLDLENYRIPVHPSDEAAALHHLFEAEDVLDAAKMILRDGYFDNEVPIVVADGNNYIVLEGNRRTSALKALQDPTIVPHFEQDIRGLLKRYSVEARDLPSSIRVLIVPTREDAAPRIARLHTGTPKKKWSRDQQANFYYSLLSPQTSVDDVKSMYPGVTVPRFIRMAAMRRFISNVPFSDKSLRDYAGGSKLTMSAFEYAYRNNALAAAIGVNFDSDGRIVPASNRPEQLGSRLKGGKKNALEHLLGKFRTEGLNTRSPHFTEGTPQQVELLQTLTYIATQKDDDDTSAGDDSTSRQRKEPPGNPAERQGRENLNETPSGPAVNNTNNNQVHEASSDEEQKREVNPRGPNHPDTKPHLDLTGLDYSRVPVGLKRRYQELRRIEIRDTPVAAATLLRLVLEGTIKVHFHLVAKERVNGMLSQAVDKLSTQYGKEPAVKTSINTVKTGAASLPGSTNWFNALSHDSDVTATGDDVRRAMDTVSPILRHLLALLPDSPRS